MPKIKTAIIITWESNTIKKYNGKIMKQGRRAHQEMIMITIPLMLMLARMIILVMILNDNNDDHDNCTPSAHTAPLRSWWGRRVHRGSHQTGRLAARGSCQIAAHASVQDPQREKTHQIIVCGRGQNESAYATAVIHV